MIVVLEAKMGNAAGASFFFWNSTRATPAEQLKAAKRDLSKGVRALDRERLAIGRREFQTKEEIKRAARRGQMGEAKLLARQLALERRNAEKLLGAKLKLKAIETRIGEAQTTAIMTKAMTDAVRAMRRLNARMDVPAVRDLLREYDRQESQMEMTREMMEDAFEEDDEEAVGEVSDAIVQQILDEIGVDFAQQLGNAPLTRAQEGDEKDVLDRLEQLRAPDPK